MGCSGSQLPGAASKKIALTPIDMALYTITGPVSSMTLVSGWKDSMTEDLKAATKLIVNQNPFLAGTIRKRNGGDAFVEADVHTDFFVEIEGPADFQAPSDTIDAVAVLQSFEPRFAEASIGRFEQILETGGPLFRIILMKLPNNHMAYVVEVNHMIADGCTYYKVLDLINRAINGQTVPTLEWKPAPENVAIPSVYTAEDKELALTGWLPGFMEKCGRYTPGTENARVVDIKIVDADNVAVLKKEYQAAASAQGLGFLSTNDFIMAGLSELVDDNGNCNMLANMRDRMPGVTTNVAGNYERMVGFPASLAAANPAFVRSLGKTWVHWGSGDNPRLSSEIPKKSTEAANFAAVTNWASLTHFIEPPGTCILGHCPPSSFVTEVAGFDLAVILKADSKGTIAVMSNHLAGKRGEELQERIKESKVFRRLFSPKFDSI